MFAVKLVSRLQTRQRTTPDRLRTRNGSPVPPQRGHSKPLGKRRAYSESIQAASFGKMRWKSGRDFGVVESGGRSVGIGWHPLRVCRLPVRGNRIGMQRSIGDHRAGAQIVHVVRSAVARESTVHRSTREDFSSASPPGHHHCRSCFIPSLATGSCVRAHPSRSVSGFLLA